MRVFVCMCVVMTAGMSEPCVRRCGKMCVYLETVFFRAEKAARPDVELSDEPMPPRMSN